MLYINFLTGTSATGKTTILNSIPDNLNDVPVTKIPLSARTPREEMGNPSFEEILNNSNLMCRQQIRIFNYFTFIIRKTIENKYTFHINNNNYYDNHDEILLFERSHFCPVAYFKVYKKYFMENTEIGKEDTSSPNKMLINRTSALLSFNTELKLLVDCVTKTNAEENDFTKLPFSMKWLKTSIDPSIPYELVPERPPEFVRNGYEDAFEDIKEFIYTIIQHNLLAAYTTIVDNNRIINIDSNSNLEEILVA